MNKMNKKLSKKIFATMVAQHPPEGLYKANNALDNKYNQEKIRERTCLLNNPDCRNQSPKMAKNQAINSHSIPRKNLKYMSFKNQVYHLATDFRNPFKNELKPSEIKTTLTFLGFCSYHDKQLFDLLENEDIRDYDQRMIFFISYRALAKNYSELREDTERLEWDIRTWNSAEHNELMQQLITLDLEGYLFLSVRNRVQSVKTFFRTRWLLFKYKCLGRRTYCKDLKFFRRQFALNSRKLDEFNRLINQDLIFNSHYVIHKNKKAIAFSLVMNRPVHHHEIFIYITALPTETGSDLVISCDESDYSLIKSDPEIIKLFQGDPHFINKILNMFRKKLAHKMDGYESSFADKFFIEWEFPLDTIEYYLPDID